LDKENNLERRRMSVGVDFLVVSSPQIIKSYCLLGLLPSSGVHYKCNPRAIDVGKK